MKGTLRGYGGYLGAGVPTTYEVWPCCPICSKPIPEHRTKVCSEQCSTHWGQLRKQGLQPDGQWQGPTRRYVTK
jgi:hypothetical protein